MKFDQLVQFVAAAKYQHLGKAAKSVHVSPGAISHSISALEEEFGKDLFEKRGKRIYLTEHGKLLAEKVQKLLLEAASIQEALASDKLELRGHFRLAGAHTLSSKFLIPAWASIQNESSELTGEIFTRRSSEVVSGIITGDYDFGLCFSPQAIIDVAIKTLHSGQMQIVVRKGHPLAGKSSKEWLQQISNFSATLPKSFRGIEVCERHPMFQKFGILTDKPSCLIDSYELAIEIVVHSNTWSLIPDCLISGDKRLRVLEPPVGWKAPYDVAAIWPHRGILSRAMVQVMQKIELCLNLPD